MKNKLLIILRALKFYRKPVFYQFLIIALLSAVITGSLLVGKSVKESLKKSSSEHLGNTGILVSSGTRYFSDALPQRLNDSTGISSAGILEINGYSQNLNSQKGAFNTHIFGVGKDFFTFHGNDTLSIRSGEIAVNRKLAGFLGISEGDELIIRFTEINDIPADAPFSPSGHEGISKVMKVGIILEPENTGNFSLSISQITPMNIFMNIEDIEDDKKAPYRNNRILIRREASSLKEASDALRSLLTPSDIGLNVRYIEKTGEYEMNSQRIFIDQEILSQLTGIFPGSAHVLTYLANRITAGNKSTPYSFVSALPSTLYPDIASGNEIIINQWMAADLSVAAGDTVKMFWYSPDSLNHLIEKSSHFTVKHIVGMEGVWADSLLMPDFPGISGKESCSEWDAGVPVNMHEIRPQDEAYWQKYRGTPKAFISYEKGRELWGNNFGPATSIRFPKAYSEKEIHSRLTSALNPSIAGFTVTDLAQTSVLAANEGVDFGTLFISLGFFLIVAALVLLSFAASSYFDFKKRDIKTLFALGFSNKWISNSLFLETGFIAISGCLIGAFGGYLVNVVITAALNTVWSGAVQTDTLHAYFSPASILTGFLVSFLTIMILMLVKVKRFLVSLHRMKNEVNKRRSPFVNSVILIISAFVTIIFIVLSLTSQQNLVWSYPAGGMMLITLVFAWRQLFISNTRGDIRKKRTQRQISHLYYSFYPSNAVMPILFIAAGIFTVFITSANRMSFSENTSRSGGTGGYLLWCDNTIPVREDLNADRGRKSMGLDDPELSAMKFIQIKRSQGNDASCLNLNHITVPPLLGVDPSDFITGKSFSFSKALKSADKINPWEYLRIPAGKNVIYGIADQTVLDWGLKIKVGDTLIIRSENGSPLRIIIAAGLQSSVFQGNILIGLENFIKFYPSVSGSSVLMVDGDINRTDQYKKTLEARLETNGVNVEKTTDRLAAFYTVTNTYLSVFSVFGALGMLTGIIGLGFVLMRNYSQRKQEFALMLAIGFHIKNIRRLIFSEQLLIIMAGVTSGIAGAVFATLPSLRNNAEVPWLFMVMVIISIILTGVIALLVSIRSVTNNSLISSLKKE